jgi:putative hydrolase of the HAD superfamily
MEILGDAPVTQAVGFDLGDTLIEYAGVPLSWEREYPVALASVASLWCDRLTDSQMEGGVAVLRRFNTRLTPRTVEVDHRILFGELLVAMDAPALRVPELVEPAADQFFGVFQRRAKAFPEAGATIKALVGEGIGVGVLTDVPYGMPRRLVVSDLVAAGLGALEGNLLTSADVGTRKPDPGGFLELAARLGCSPRQVTFVGNEEKDITGALAAGMHAVLVWRGEGVAPAWGQHHSVSELGGVLGLAATFEQAYRADGVR